MNLSGSRKDWQKESNTRSIINVYISALSALRNPVVALPSLIYFALHILIMAIYLNIQSPALHSFWALFIRGIAPEIFRHYPHHIILMQAVLGRFDILLDIFIHIIIQGATVAMVGSVLSRGNPDAAPSFSLTFKRYGHLLAVSIISSGIIFLVLNISEMVTGALIPGGRLIFAGASILAALAVQGLFVYTTPFILLEGEDAFSSIGKSSSLACHSVILTALLVVIPFILTLPSVLLDIKAEMISFRLSPDFIIYNHIVGELLQTIATYLITAGSAVIVIMKRTDLLEQSDEMKED
ncbi:MAG: hypothetical protein GF417_07055 [Candidatus Latescibacteria bacterium]|nr:hypothetical protein [bacterium]MBD3424177.1 hypothetical protein [Candidatus Latescibacterota bacterium]